MNIEWIAAVIVLLAATLRVTTPILLAAFGETISERAGVLNLGIEGIMTVGALAGFLGALKTGSLAVGLVSAGLAGLVAGLLLAVLVVHLGLNQHVSGLGITLLGTALSLYFYRVLFGEPRVPPRIEPFAPVQLPFSLGVLTPLMEQDAITYCALALAPLLWWLLYRSRFGLRIRAVGDNPQAADVAGVNVYAVRTFAVCLGTLLMALAGAYLSLVQLGAFSYGIVAGRGWVALALVIFGNWRPYRVLAGALLFGFLQALQLRIQAVGVAIPYQVLLALPYLFTIAALSVASRSIQYPAALLKPYRREG